MRNGRVDAHGIHVYYKPPGLCEAVELFPSSNPTYNSRRFFGQPFSQVQSWMLALDPEALTHPGGLESFALGIALSAPAFKGPDEPVEAVLAFERGYYDKSN
jgi:hypothetical protein